jgi:hypothetical protein
MTLGKTLMNNPVQSITLTPQGTFFGKKFVPLTPQQVLVEKAWKQFLDNTLGPELQPEELEAQERALKKFKGISGQKLENPHFWKSWAPTWAEYSRRNLNRGLLLLNRLGAVGIQDVFLGPDCIIPGIRFFQRITSLQGPILGTPSPGAPPTGW